MPCVDCCLLRVSLFCVACCLLFVVLCLFKYCYAYVLFVVCYSSFYSLFSACVVSSLFHARGLMYAACCLSVVAMDMCGLLVAS